MTYRRLCLGLVVFFLAAGAWGNSDQLLTRLQPQGYVSDFAGKLPAQQRQALENYLAELERQTGVEVAVVTVPSLEGGEVDDFTNRLFGKWGVGKRGKNNGVMILAAIQDRKGRIEVGYGLEGVLPDALAGRILRDTMFPYFKQGRYGDGLLAAANEVGRLVSQQSGVAAPALAGAPARHQIQTGSPMLGLVVLVGMIIFFIFVIRRSTGFRRTYYGSGWTSGGGFSSGGGGGFSGFSGGSSGGGGASGSW